MNIQGTLSSWGSSFASAASSCGTTMKSCGEAAVEKGKMGYNRAVSVITENPKQAAVTALAVLLIAVGVGYAFSGSEQVDPAAAAKNMLGEEPGSNQVPS